MVRKASVRYDRVTGGMPQYLGKCKRVHQLNVNGSQGSLLMSTARKEAYAPRFQVLSHLGLGRARAARSRSVRKAGDAVRYKYARCE